jgi:endonuclease I
MAAIIGRKRRGGKGCRSLAGVKNWRKLRSAMHESLGKLAWGVYAEGLAPAITNGALMRLRRYPAVVLGVLLLTVQALGDAYDPPAGYYDAATGTGAALKSQLTTIMSTGHIQRTYGDFRFSAAIHDADPNNLNNILLVYNRASVPATWDNGITWNREHIWPISLQGGNDPSNSSTGHRADPHALRPANPAINTARGNKAFGFETTTGSHGHVDTTYYFPGDADKGDVARQLFYSATRWSSLGLTLTDSVPGSYEMGDLSSLIAWHYLDPPDTFERRRNHAIYSQALNPVYYTNNRNAFVDRPEYVWSVYVDQMNDSRISIGGAAVGGDGGSTRNVDLGRVLVGSPAPAGQEFTLVKDGDDGTYYSVTTAGEATSSLSGRYNAFRTNGADSEPITVGLGTSTATAGLRSGTVTIDNLDVTTGVGAGHGANDANDSFSINLSVLDHAQPSFASGAVTTSLVVDFGQVIEGSAAPLSPIEVYNLEATAGYTADMDFDSFLGSGDTAAFVTDFADWAGSLSLGAGESEALSAMFDTATPGAFSASYTLTFSDEDLAGAASSSLTLTLMGEVLEAGLPGDYNGDGRVDAADYIVWRTTYGDTVPAFSGADGDGDEQIGDGDYTVWAQNFGAAAGGGAARSVPEPAAMWLAVFLLTAGSASARWGRRAARPVDWRPVAARATGQASLA